MCVCHDCDMLASLNSPPCSELKLDIKEGFAKLSPQRILHINVLGETKTDR